MGLVVEEVHDEAPELAILLHALPVLVPESPGEVVGQDLFGKRRQQIVGHFPVAVALGEGRSQRECVKCLRDTRSAMQGRSAPLGPATFYGAPSSRVTTV